MPDIAMCKDHECPSRVHCYRYRAKPYEHGQAYGCFKHEGERCEAYRSTAGWHDSGLLPMETLNWIAKAEVKDE